MANGVYLRVGSNVRNMDIREFFNSLTPEQIEEGNKKQLEENQRVYNEFKAAYKKGICSLCGKPMNSFEEDKPCFHWFLKPDGIKKKHFKKYLSTPIGFFRFDSYIRWIANIEEPFKNINDLQSEKNPAKVSEYTVKYNDIEWSINIGQKDRHGHLNSKNANFPHFHLQMKAGNNVFLRFNDFHIPLSDEDIFTFRAIEEASDKVVWRNTFGEGISILENEESIEQLDKLMKRTDDIKNATFNTSSMIELPEGVTISDEMLNKMIEESKESEIPLRHIVKKYYPESNIITEIRPGDGVPKISKRKKR
jgi:ssDNA-binding Zn-finger/Zn-ribbon topoisomerase 1